ncbi:5-(carboxyamino)imidazole ribonucleotide mutase [Lactobacillaceae bacterium L1_55_11]|nr:5-(carboxyamino)imidazole ribonucleotide mutase [Lactobacillaceae bacterium L1_55_11]
MTARVAVVMGSTSDWPVMKNCFELLAELGITADKHVISAHRMPAQLQEFGQTARDQGLEIIIAGAGGAAHLPGMLAANTTLPVIGVPMKSSNLNGLDSLLSIVQMPAGVPVGTMAIGPAGAKNAALYAASILGLQDEDVAQALTDYRQRQTQASIDSEEDLT